MSDELARAFTSGDSGLYDKAREFDKRKQLLSKRINRMLGQDDVQKFRRRFQKSPRSRSGSRKKSAR